MFKTGASAAADVKMILTSGGNLGIGTSSPAAKVHIAASSYAAPTGGIDSNLNLLINNTQYAGLGLLGASNGSSFIHFGDGDNMDVGEIAYVHSDNYMRFVTNATERMRIDSTGAVTMPTQPAFQVKPASTQTNIGADETVAFGTERFDQNADFASNTFTAPVTGKYQFNVSIRIDNWDISANYYQVIILTSNRSYITTWDAALHASADHDYITLTISTLADMDANDTSLVQINQNAGAAQADINTESLFSGYLAC